MRVSVRTRSSSSSCAIFGLFAASTRARSPSESESTSAPNFAIVSFVASRASLKSSSKYTVPSASVALYQRRHSRDSANISFTLSIRSSTDARSPPTTQNERRWCICITCIARCATRDNADIGRDPCEHCGRLSGSAVCLALQPGAHLKAYKSIVSIACDTAQAGVDAGVDLRATSVVRGVSVEQLVVHV
eukprot:IDg17937t1